MRFPPYADSGASAAWMPRWWLSKAAQRARFLALVFALPGAASSG